MENSLNPKIERTHLDQTLEIAAGVVLALLLMFTFYAYGTLPEIIPTHFNLQGEPNDYSRKSMLFVMPGLGIAIAALLIYMSQPNRDFSKYNYPMRVRPENTGKLYNLMARLLRIVALMVALLMAFVTFMIYTSAKNGNTAPALGITVILIIFLPLLPLIIFMIQASKLR